MAGERPMAGSDAEPATGLPEAARSLTRLIGQVTVEADPVLEEMVQGAVRVLRAGGRVLLAGNGGSAAQCQHLAAELTGRFMRDRTAYAALALTTDTSFLTACANDYGFEHVFARQIEALGRAGDVLLLLSTGGRSPNLLRAAASARKLGLTIYALLGRDGGELASACDQAIVVPHDDSARIQEVHLLLGHVFCGTIEERVEASD